MCCLCLVFPPLLFAVLLSCNCFFTPCLTVIFKTRVCFPLFASCSCSQDCQKNLNLQVALPSSLPSSCCVMSCCGVIHFYLRSTYHLLTIFKTIIKKCKYHYSKKKCVSGICHCSYYWYACVFMWMIKHISSKGLLVNVHTRCLYVYMTACMSLCVLYFIEGHVLIDIQKKKNRIWVLSFMSFLVI